MKSKGERREGEREKKKVNYSLKVEVWSTKARKFSGIEAIRRIVIMKSAARRTREKAPLPPAPNPLFRYFPNTERGRCSLSSAAVSSTRGRVFNNTRDKTSKGGPELSTYPFLSHLPSPRFLSMESSAVDNETVSTPVEGRRTKKKRGKKRGERIEEREKETERKGKEISRVNFHREKEGGGERGRKSVPRRPGETINSVCCSIFHRAICKSRE